MRQLVPVILTSCALMAQTAPGNLDFEAGRLGQAPSGWHLTTVGGAEFHATVVDHDCLQRRHCVVLNGPEVSSTGAFANFYERASAGARLPARTRFRAAVRVEGAGTKLRMWMLVERRGGARSFQNSSDISVAKWNYFTLDADIGPDTQQVTFGFVMYGTGKAWVDDASLGEAREAPQGPTRSVRRAWRA